MLALVLALVVAREAPAQSPASPPADDAASVCLGFQFGRWTPALDWRAAGHGRTVDSAGVERAPGGRGWAAPGAAAGDSTLMLFPAWWPVGVAVDLRRRPSAFGDTVAGMAAALVNDARTRAPQSRVRAWRVPCRR